MTPRQVELVQQSWARVEPIADTTARLFYRRLFELAPHVRSMFTTSVSEQSDKLLSTLTDIVDHLNELDALGYDQSEQHAVVSQSLIWSLEQSLGGAFTPEVREAWLEAYAHSDMTITAAVGVEAQELELIVA